MEKFFKKIKKVLKNIYMLLLIIIVASCGKQASSNKTSITILSTSDIHGKFLPYNYITDKEDRSGSLTQISTLVNKLRNENTLLIDLGDNIQGNFSETFINDNIHPMVYAQNLMHYDIHVIGNHDFDYGMDTVRKLINDQEGDVLCGNVFYENGECIAKPYVIKEVDNVKIAIIGMTTQEIEKTYKNILQTENIIVKNPVDEIKKVVSDIKDEVDVIVVVCHIGIKNANDIIKDSYVTANDIALSVPEVDLILASHTHKKIDGVYEGNSLIVENSNAGKTLNCVVLDLEKNKDTYEIVNKKSVAYDTKDYEEDILISENELIKNADKKAKEKAREVIARLNNEKLTPDNDVNGVPEARLRDTALTRLINDALMYYADADIATIPLYNDSANLYRGDIRKCDLSLLYQYDNTLYKLSITGRQLKKMMEENSIYFNQYKKEDLTISVDPEFNSNYYHIFGGLKYIIDISKDEGERIVDLSLLNGEKIDFDKNYNIAVNNFSAESFLLIEGEIFDKEDGLPILVEKDVRSDLGGIRELIYDYIINVKGKPGEDGVIELEVEDVDDTNANWKVVWG